MKNEENETDRGLRNTESEHTGILQSRGELEVCRQGSTGAMASIWTHTQPLCQGNYDFDPFLPEIL
jgi:hypothetical protein